MPDLPPIHRAIEFIEAHLRAEITVADMATAAGYSLYHFIRTFNQVTFFTPYEYLMRRRLSEAARDLLSRDRRVIDIAIDYRFSNHETFTRAFKRMFNLLPSQWRELPAIPRRALMPPLNLAHLEHFHVPGFPCPQLLETSQRCLAGLMIQLSDETNRIPQLWENFHQVLQNIPGLPKKPAFFAVTTHIETPPGLDFYLAALELAVPAPPTLVSQVLPAGKHVCIQHPGSAHTVPLTLDFLYHIWLPKAGLRPALPLEIEHLDTALIPAGDNAPRKVCIPLV